MAPPWGVTAGGRVLFLFLLHLIWAVPRWSNGPGWPIPFRLRQLLKRPSAFPKWNPRSPGAFLKCVLSFRKRIFSRFKMRFHYLQVCHWNLIAYKMLILTPFLSIQIALDSSFRDLRVSITVFSVWNLSNFVVLFNYLFIYRKSWKIHIFYVLIPIFVNFTFMWS